jgi:16S rRNA (guanine527-N7)-methyltransferase
VAEPAGLSEALASSQRVGILGDRPIPEVIEHARAFVTALADVHGVVVDLGAGGGVPGLVIAHDRPDLRLVLIDRRRTRTDHLRRLVARLGWGNRVEVVAADVAGIGALVAPADAAVARGFGPPLTTLAAAARLVVTGGLLVVSEPPDPDPTRWPAAKVAAAGWNRVPSPDPRVATFRRRST